MIVTQMSQTRRTGLRSLAAAALALGVLAAAPVQAQSYPRLVNPGENAEVDYGPGGSPNIVGGGQVVEHGSGENRYVTYLNPRMAQAAPSNLTPVVVDPGENQHVVWVPADVDRRALALATGDGTLPNLAPIGTNSRTAMNQGRNQNRAQN
jgi:hypothetical protein